ncbi:MAG: bifunctional aspartate kinase/homoserine dehydrogenase I [Saprospiraceae bacterium]|nr:bifunctional aspartate kinase/homoserine dehydrogenase I [Saprospiraceae bacterium]
MKVLKFGGSSVAKPERIRGIVSILQKYHARGDRFTVVFSAFGGVTDGLIDMATKAEQGNETYLTAFEQVKTRHIEAAQELLSAARFAEVLPTLTKATDDLLGVLRGIFLIHEVSPRTLDYVVSFGERLSNLIIAHTLDESGIPAEFLDARKVIKTDKNFGSAKVDFEETDHLVAEHYATHSDKIQIVTGFIGSVKGTSKGKEFGLTTTLGRGGSDYTAAIIAAGLNADVIEIWTDVDGVLTADPRKVKKAFTIPTMTYAEAMEMSHFGAKVIYPPTLQPAFRKQIPLYIKNTFNPDFIGTLVSNKREPSAHAVQGISSISNVSLLTLSGSGLFGVPGVAGRLFAGLAAASINIILITQGSSESSISFAVNPNDAPRAKKAVEKAFEYELKNGTVNPLSIESDLAVVAIVGEGMRYRPGIAGLMFHSLGKNGVNCVAIAQGSSELNISVVVPRHDEAKALNALHEGFFLSDAQTLNLYIMGVGLIGKTLIRQIADTAEFLKKNRYIEIKIVGLSNSRKMLFDENGIDQQNFMQQLSEKGETANPSVFVEKMKALNLPNTIFVDVTASKEVADLYHSILDSSVSISTANKIANSAAYKNYTSLKETAIKRSIRYCYETNVGAGLPVISTLSDLIISGDRILKIEGVLSGSLSFIFNNFKQGVTFSDIVTKAKELGYTEPDPRIDLTGVDVRRKLVILAREAGLTIEQEDVEIKNFLPEPCLSAKTVDEFFENLKNADAAFDKMLANTVQGTPNGEGGKLRMIAKVENGKATIGLETVDANNPFYTLDGSDNMIVFTTERYRERPLVVRGPGAGAEVTAAGVFAEVIAIGNYLG